VAGDKVAPGDYDADGKADLTVFSPSKGEWYVLKSTDSTTDIIELGTSGDIPVPGDFDGDHITDAAVYRPGNGYWYVQQSNNGYLAYPFGGSQGDVPVAADFSGDGLADFGIFSLKNGMWYLTYSGSESSFGIQFGLEGDIPVAGDYDGDGHADIAAWRPDDDTEGNGCWYILYAASDFEDYDSIPWGVSDDVPVPGDYDGDGKSDVAVWRPSTGVWHILESSNGYYSKLFGASGDIPVGRKTETGMRPGMHFKGDIPPNARPQRKAG
jgi:hypothetical protein